MVYSKTYIKEKIIFTHLNNVDNFIQFHLLLLWTEVYITTIEKSDPSANILPCLFNNIVSVHIRQQSKTKPGNIHSILNNYLIKF